MMSMHFERRRERLLLTTDATKFDVDAIHEYLSKEAYWCLGIPRDVVERAIAHSIAFGVLDGNRQAGFARAVTDRATFAWVCDVYVLPEYRGRGLALWMLESMMAHPELHGLRRWVLATRDAHDLYRRVGFVALPNPAKWMIVVHPDVYTQA